MKKIYVHEMFGSNARVVSKVPNLHKWKSASVFGRGPLPQLRFVQLRFVFHPFVCVESYDRGMQ